VRNSHFGRGSVLKSQFRRDSSEQRYNYKEVFGILQGLPRDARNKCSMTPMAGQNPPARFKAGSLTSIFPKAKSG
jgi:hypothetical protein